MLAFVKLHNSTDHEVHIPIHQIGPLTTLNEEDKTDAEITGEVATTVIAINGGQPIAVQETVKMIIALVKDAQTKQMIEMHRLQQSLQPQRPAQIVQVAPGVHLKK